MDKMINEFWGGAKGRLYTRLEVENGGQNRGAHLTLLTLKESTNSEINFSDFNR